MIRSILAPVTASGACARSAEIAAALARRFGAELTILHVYGFEHRWGEAELLARPGELEGVRKAMEKRFAPLLEGLGGPGVAVAQGVPHVEILRHAREQGADLVVMCPASGDIPRMDVEIARAGRTVERVVELAHCPVMLTGTDGQREAGRVGHVVAATRLGPADMPGVEYAGRLAGMCGAGVSVLHVLDTRGEAAMMSQGAIARESAERAARMNREYQAALAGAKSVEYACWEGDTEVEILKLARRRGADVIVMTHRGGEADPECAFERSLVLRVACRALCPVLSVSRAMRQQA